MGSSETVTIVLFLLCQQVMKPGSISLSDREGKLIYVETKRNAKQTVNRVMLTAYYSLFSVLNLYRQHVITKSVNTT